MAENDTNNTKRSNIVPMSITSEMKESFIAYAMSVITSRALPDVRDGLKPVHRRILYAMNDLNLSASSRFRKSATVVGEVLGKYHPHGDTSVYDAMVNLAQDFSTRYPMVWGQGNFGSIDGDSPAAMRYTEAKMQKITGEMLRDIEKDTVNFIPNYDDSQQEPTVLPTAIPTLLLNGGLGIAVGMATNIPPHNLGEVIDATVALIDDPKSTVDDLLEHVKGPDFPLGGIAYNVEDIKNAYASGRGRVVTRGEAEIIETKKGGHQIIISSIPFRVNKQNLIVKIADLVRDKKIKGIKGLRDESTKDIRVVIDLKSSAQPRRVLNYIYKHTQLQENFNFNVVCLVDGVPQTLGLKDILEHFITHRQEVVRRRTEYDLKKAEARAHILEGLNTALDHIDEVIALIKKSKDSKTAKTNLMKKFKFSEIQAQAILDMKLQKLAGLERKKIEDELKEILKYIKELKSLLKSVPKMLAVIKDELLEIKERYADERRTRIVEGAVNSIKDEDLIPQKEFAMVYTENGYIKRTDPTEYKSQKRGGVGVIDLDTKDDDIVTHFVIANSHSDMLFFSDAGKVYQTKMYDLPEGRRSTKGKSIKNFLPLEGEEKITSILSIPKDKELHDLTLLFATKKGVVKRVEAEAFKNVRSNGLIAINLKADDELWSVRLVHEKDESILVTRDGQSIRSHVSDFRTMGRTAGGVRGIKLKKDDEVVGLGIISHTLESADLLVLTENGYGKRTAISEYKNQNRGGSGIKTLNVTNKTGRIAGAKIVDTQTEILAMSQQSQVIRTSLDSVSKLGRATQGVRVMKLRDGDSVASLTII
ncbi:DNA gyrase subunit A [Candidatus Campbellbacteria bacterium]|nr:DNA gyrase subunit A [Candidatus Campbellbacteria bacterium]